MSHQVMLSDRHEQSLVLWGDRLEAGGSASIASLHLREQITVEAWITSDTPSAEVMQALVSQWSPPPQFGQFDAYDAAGTDGLDSTGYFGAVFDGRYVYFVPEQHPSLETHAIVLRFDTHGEFHSRASYAAYDASRTDGLDVRGFYGGGFDGRYVYFVPRQLGLDRYHSRILRFDSRGEFRDPKSWSAFDAGLEQSAQGAAFDGRYLYLAPGFRGDPRQEDQYCSVVIRYDTRAGFKSASSYATADAQKLSGDEAACYDGAAFDGRYIYFVPLYNHIAIRYDTQREFNDASGWQRMDLTPMGAGLFVGAVFDGRYLYYVPYACAAAIRFDTTADFADRAAWQVTDVDHVDGLRTSGFDGGFFDGRYVYFVPFVYGGKEQGYSFHGNLLRYDPLRPFDDRRAWSARDGSRTGDMTTTGYNAGAFDGRFFYFAPWQQGKSPQTGQPLVHGKVLRYDTLGRNGAFSLRYCDYGHNGGLTAAVPGPSFLINTQQGPVSIAAHRIIRPGRHHLAGTYDGHSICLYIDGELVGSRAAAAGAINSSDLPLTLGHLCDGMSRFRGSMHAVRVTSATLHARQIEQSAREGWTNG